MQSNVTSRNGERVLTTQDVWKSDGITMRCVPEPKGAFDCALAAITADEKPIPCDAFLTSLRASFQYLPSVHAPTSRIAFIVFLKPRILSTRVRL